jgi:hypothetical protein
MIGKISKASVTQFVGEHGGTVEYARFAVLMDKLNEVIDHLNKEVNEHQAD